MPQSINKKKIYFYLVSFLFISTIFNNNLISNLKNVFKITEVKVENTKKEINDNILSNTSFLLGENIFFVNKNFLIEKFNKLDFIESISIKKKYPSIINIQTKQTNLIAFTYLDQKKYFVGQNGNFIIAKQISNKKKLPIIFGKFEPDDYIFLQKELLSQKIDLNEITRYYFHKNKRWDLYFENNILVKLPEKNIFEAIKLYKLFKSRNGLQANSTVDLRIPNRIVVKNE
ncbi:FtsQ-type POTRA domain-containing protein [Candidatus Pelagibacter sp.]|nr:FtsQ-type POTRA domain-containing protein [Candidatus Pelagibacter sp.]